MNAPPNALRSTTVTRGTLGRRERVHELRAVTDDARALLRRCRAGSPGVSTSTTSGRPNASQVRTNRAALRGRLGVEHAAEVARLVGDDADGAAVEARERA